MWGFGKKKKKKDKKMKDLLDRGPAIGGKKKKKEELWEGTYNAIQRRKKAMKEAENY